MLSYKKQNKYQLVYPVKGTKIYQSNSLNKGARKCFNDLKLLENFDSPFFKIINIDTGEAYLFKINKKANNSKNNGIIDLDLSKNSQESVQSIKYNNDNFNDIKSMIKNLNIKINKLEDRIDEISLNIKNNGTANNLTEPKFNMDKIKINDINHIDMDKDNINNIDNIAAAISNKIFNKIENLDKGNNFNISKPNKFNKNNYEKFNDSDPNNNKEDTIVNLDTNESSDTASHNKSTESCIIL